MEGMNGLLIYVLYIVPPMILGLWAQSAVNRNFRKWSEVPSSTGRSGAEIARMILDRNGLNGVPVEEVPGELSDHYDPRTRTVRLSQSVYGQRSIAAVSVAAHEVGHAIQHAKSYLPMQARTAVFPVTSFSSNLWFPLLLGGAFLNIVGLVQIAILLYAFVVLFHIVTLPVELNASSRAKKQLRELGFGIGQDTRGTSKVLNAAAMTYVAGALAALSQLLYFAMMFLGNRD
jgi:Zn-dependent membrane protease YugP